MIKFFLSGLFSILTFSAMANAFSVTAIGTVHYIEPNNSGVTLSYQFNIKNQLFLPLYLNNASVSGLLPNVVVDTVNTTCKFYADGVIAPLSPEGSDGDNCNLVYKGTVPVLPAGVERYAYLDNLTVAEQTGLTKTYKDFGVTVDNSISYKGHLVYKNSSGTAITTLNLGPSEANSITVENTGGTTIANFHLAGFNTVMVDSGSCNWKTTLAAGASCTIEYSTGLSPVADTFTIEGTGTTATMDNTPHTLTVNVAP